MDSEQRSGRVSYYVKTAAKWYAKAWSQLLPTIFLFGLNLAALLVMYRLFGFEESVIYGLGMILVLVEIALFGGNDD